MNGLMKQIAWSGIVPLAVKFWTADSKRIFFSLSIFHGYFLLLEQYAVMQVSGSF